MNRYLFSILLVLFTFSKSNVRAQHLQSKKLDSLLNNLILHNKSMGSLAISKGENKLYEKSFGYSYIAGSKKVSLSNETRYRTGSITKVFTAVLILQLIENGKLSLNTPVTKFFPTLPNAKRITIANLLTHQSGLFNYTDDWDSWRFNHTSEEKIVAMIAEAPTLFEPGTKTEYNNSGYILLGYIIEKLYKKPYKTVLAEKITSKYGLNHTYYGGKVDVNKKEAFSYAFEKDAWVQQPETDMSAANGAGSIVSTPTDLNKFMHLLFSKKLISKPSLDIMLGMQDGQGMVLEKMPFYDKTLYAHSGQIDYYQSWMLYFPEDNLAITYISNGFGGEPINAVLKGVLHIVFDKPYTLPNYSSVELLPKELEKLVGEYSCEQPLMKVNITKAEKTLFAQAEGQSPFPLTAKSKDEFHYVPAGIVIKFTPSNEEFILIQGGGEFKFKKLY